ncbi:MAG: carboxymuconolactone decarboxylase family protein [Planctomycetaceae bacterium]
MPLPTPALDALRDSFPEEFRDTRLNIESVLASEHLSPAQAFGVALASVRFLRATPLAAAIESDLRAGLGEAADTIISDSTAAAGLMAMNTVYYRFRHMVGKERYASRPPRLRMQRMAKPLTSHADFELMSLACAALAGCEYCIQNHEAKLVEQGTGEEACHECVRIAAVMAAAACGLAPA